MTQRSNERHAYGPRKLYVLDILADYSSIVDRQTLEPLPHRFASAIGSIEAGGQPLERDAHAFKCIIFGTSETSTPQSISAPLVRTRRLNSPGRRAAHIRSRVQRPRAKRRHHLANL